MYSYSSETILLYRKVGTAVYEQVLFDITDLYPGKVVLEEDVCGLHVIEPHREEMMTHMLVEITYSIPDNKHASTIGIT